ncbi:MAG: hypothetical protein GF401_04020 [Chitinivibrionales bacterium]|nr:hypothetical protein [Chitinivibrionales bacterium]
MKKSAVVVCILLFIVGCSKKDSSELKRGVFSINGEWIKKEEIHQVGEFLRNDMNRLFPGRIFEGASDNMKKQAAHHIASQKLLLAEAKKKNYPIDTAELRKNVAAIKGGFDDQKTFEEELAKWGQTEKDLYDQVSYGIMLDSLMRELFQNIDPVSDEECRQFYEENKDKFKGRKKTKVSQIVILSGKDTTESAETALKSKAQEIVTKLKAGEDFAACARKYSQGPAARDGGDMGWFETGDLRKEFEEALASLKPGQISPVVETGMGYHILKKIDEKALAPESLDQVKKQIVMLLEVKKKNEFLMEYVDGLMQSADIHFTDSAYSFPPDAQFGSLPAQIPNQ